MKWMTWIFIGIACGWSFTTMAKPKFQQAFEHEGLKLEVLMEPIDPPLIPREHFWEQEAVRFQLRVTDANQKPLSGLFPAAWIGHQGEKPVSHKQCQNIVQTFITGSILAPPEVDLNVFYVLTLNNDSTISVVDPLFGYGTTKLRSMVFLDAPGHDWALSHNQRGLFVSVPGQNHVAVVDTDSWKVMAKIPVAKPTRTVLQPDGHYLWVSYQDGPQAGVAVIDTQTLQVIRQIPTGQGPHTLTFDQDSQLSFVANRNAHTVSVIDVRTLTKKKDLPTGEKPVWLDYSATAQVVYVSHRGGGIAAIDVQQADLIARIPTQPGLGQVGFTPNGRFALAVNTEQNILHIVDVATNRILQSGEVETGPEEIAFSDEVAYIRHRGSETVLMLTLDTLGQAQPGDPIQVIDFPGGQGPFGAIQSPAASIVQAPGASAVLVAHPKDQTISYYKEGMAAPMGHFKNYKRTPKAVLALDRSLDEAQPGVYETVAALGRSGTYQLAVFLDSPRVVQCLPLTVAVDPKIQKERIGGMVVEHLLPKRVFRMGETIPLTFRLKDPESQAVQAGVPDVWVLSYLVPGLSQQRHPAKELKEGLYQVDFIPQQSGIYSVYVASPSKGLQISNPQRLDLQILPAQ